MTRGVATIERKTPQQVALMREAGLVVAQALAAMREAAAVGVTTGDLDDVAAAVLARAGAKPSFLGYHGYPATICASVNEEVVHGIPSRRRVLADGDVVSVDVGAVVDGWHGDAAVTLTVGEVAPAVRRLVDVTEAALWAAIARLRPGAHLGDVGAAVTHTARRHGLGVVKEYTGHGIGTEMHMEPTVSNHGRAGRGLPLEEGNVLAVEPMLTLGRRHVLELADGWTVVTKDRSPAAHWEHTVAITADGPWVLTAPDGGAARLGRAPAA